MQANEITPYSLGEEIANAVTHGLGTAAAIVALTLMMVKSAGALGVLPTSRGSPSMARV